MESLSNLVALLKRRAVGRPSAGFTFLAQGEAESANLTYAELDAQARALAALLRHEVPPGERALLLYPPGLEFIAAFFGCLYAGVVAVPAYPPRLHDRTQVRLRAIARDAAPRVVLSTAAIRAAVLDGQETGGRLLASLPELQSARWIATDDPGIEPAAAELAEPAADALAFLQYTSGSTATPKGVMVTHANLLHNERMIGAAFEQDRESVVVGWLPLYHDMGLIGNVLQPLSTGARCVLLPPVAFLQKPLRWLAAIDRYRGTTSGGPNFAYDLCVRRIGAEERQGLDLSSWRVAFNGAEPVRAATLDRFAEAFVSCGFRRQAFYPCYGLAEATLFVAGGVHGVEPRVKTVASAALERHEVLPVEAGSREGRSFVGCGRGWSGQRVVIADLAAGTECPPGRVGEIWVSGPSVARGYWRRPEATERDFQAFLAGTGEGPFLRTGDLGFLADGELFVTGRSKDLIILRGRNHYPQDIELTVEQADPALRSGCGAAFAVEVAGEERLVVVQEVERRLRDGLAEVAERVRRAVAEEHEAQVHEVVLIRAGSLPKTSSGKVQRHACRAAYAAGELAVVGRSGAAAAPAAPRPALTLSRGTLSALEPAERSGVLEAFLRERAAAVVGTSPDGIDPAQPLTGLGLDSLAAVELKGAVEAALELPLPLADLLQGAGTAALAERLLAALDDPAAEPGGGPVAAVEVETSSLSHGQRALWFLEQLAPESGHCNIVVAARAPGLDSAALRRALDGLTARHAALRACFPREDDQPVQRRQGRCCACGSSPGRTASGCCSSRSTIWWRISGPWRSWRAISVRSIGRRSVARRPASSLSCSLRRMGHAGRRSGWRGSGASGSGRTGGSSSREPRARSRTSTCPPTGRARPSRPTAAWRRRRCCRPGSLKGRGRSAPRAVPPFTQRSSPPSRRSSAGSPGRSASPWAAPRSGAARRALRGWSAIS
jgi:acyl-CoA synthetase (AMP-forming)/AMP-acid ligase II/acyl carrier protein